VAPPDELRLARSVAGGDCGGDPRLWIQPDTARQRVYRRMDPRRHRSRHVAEARARLGPDNAHLYRRACAYHQDLPPRAGPHRTLAPLYRCCRLAGHQHARYARRRSPCAPHHGAAQRPGPARGRARPHAALRRQDGNAGASHRARASTRRASPPATPTWQASRSHSTACCARCKRPSCSRCALSTMQATSCARPSR